MKIDKNDGYEGLCSEYFRSGASLLYDCIPFLCTCMINLIDLRAKLWERVKSLKHYSCFKRF